MKNKRVVIHSSPVWLPKTQIWMYNQVRYLSDDIENHIICDRTENLDQFNVPNIHCLGNDSFWRRGADKIRRRMRVPRRLRCTVERAFEIRADLLHSHFGNVGWENLGAARQARMVHVVTFYGQDVNFLPKSDPQWVERYCELFETADRILCEGPHMARCVAYLGCPPEKILVHHLGVDVKAIPFHPRKWAPGQTLRILISASFREKKGIPYAIEALGKLQHEAPLEITIIGDASLNVSSQVEKQKIIAALDAHYLRPKTRLLGYQPYAVLLREAYNHHVFLSPSVTAIDGDTEGGAPVTLIDTAASGMPIISTRHCDIPEVVLDGVSGLLAGERDVEGLLFNLRWLLEHPDRWESLTSAARKHIETEYDAAKQSARLSNIYRSLC